MTCVAHHPPNPAALASIAYGAYAMSQGDTAALVPVAVQVVQALVVEDVDVRAVDGLPAQTAGGRGDTVTSVHGCQKGVVASGGPVTKSRRTQRIGIVPTTSVIRIIMTLSRRCFAGRSATSARWASTRR